MSECTPGNILSYFSEPTLIEIDLGRPQWLLVSTLLHGNELVGLDLIKRLAGRLRVRVPEKNLAIFVGNVKACHQGVRHLDGQPDFNRVWDLDFTEDMPGFARKLLSWARTKNIFATIDLHNNTGKNPLYACITNTEPNSIYMGSLFAKTIVYFENPRNVFSRAFSHLAPSVTLECGTPSNQLGYQRAFDYVCDMLALKSLEVSQISHQDFELYQTLGRIRVAPGLNVGFNTPDTQVNFRPDLDGLNFTSLKTGDVIGHWTGNTLPLQVLDDNGIDVTATYFDFANNQIRPKISIVPSMLTKNLGVIKSDCLGYLMLHRKDVL